MGRTKYDRVYVWKPALEAWEQVVCQDSLHAETVRARLQREGHEARLGLSTIGPPEGAPR